MASEIGGASSYDLSNCAKSLECPVTFNPLNDAVMLTPCGHTISEIAAKNIYRGMMPGGVEQQSPCPLCQRRVKAYYPNLIVRDLVGSLRRMHLEETLPVVSKKVAEIDLHTIPFPGKSANFALSNGNLNDNDSYDGYFRRCLTFSSQTEGSLFKKMGFSESRNNRIFIDVYFNKENADLVSDYFLKCGIKLNEYNNKFGFYQSNKVTTNVLFKILIMHNELPEEYISLIREAILSSS